MPIKANRKKVVATILNPDKETTASGLFIPMDANTDTSQTKFARVTSSRMDGVRENDIVVFDRISGTPIEENQIILDESDILAIVDESLVSYS